MKIQNKRGRKSKTLFGYENQVVDTWYLNKDNWIYIGKCRKRVAGTHSEGDYNYYTEYDGSQIKQALSN